MGPERPYQRNMSDVSRHRLCMGATFGCHRELKMERDPYYETTEEWGWDVPEECPYCGGDGGDPFNDYVLPCPFCEGEG